MSRPVKAPSFVRFERMTDDQKREHLRVMHGYVVGTHISGLVLNGAHRNEHAHFMDSAEPHTHDKSAAES